MRRVLQIPRGTVQDWSEYARLIGVTELEERDDLPAGRTHLVEEETPPPSKALSEVDWQAEWAMADTVDRQLRVLARMLHLE